MTKLSELFPEADQPPAPAELSVDNIELDCLFSQGRRFGHIDTKTLTEEILETSTVSNTVTDPKLVDVLLSVLKNAEPVLPVPGQIKRPKGKVIRGPQGTIKIPSIVKKPGNTFRRRR